MTNIEIICNECVAAGLYSEEEIEGFISGGQIPPVHTFQYWKNHYGLVPKKGTHAAIQTRIWRKKAGKKEDAEDEVSREINDRDFYLTKAFLFTQDQVEPMKGGK